MGCGGNNQNVIWLKDDKEVRAYLKARKGKGAVQEFAVFKEPEEPTKAPTRRKKKEVASDAE